MGTMSVGWEPAFVAMSVLVGEPLELTLDALGGAIGNEAAEVSRGLASPSRDARAQTMARALSEVALAIDAVRLA
jgi:hypothetical protein